MAERYCRCNHSMRAHEVRSGGKLGCYLVTCSCIDFVERDGPKSPTSPNVRVEGSTIQVKIEHHWSTVGYIDAVDAPMFVDRLERFEDQARRDGQRDMEITMRNTGY